MGKKPGPNRPSTAFFPARPPCVRMSILMVSCDKIVFRSRRHEHLAAGWQENVTPAPLPASPSRVSPRPLHPTSHASSRSLPHPHLSPRRTHKSIDRKAKAGRARGYILTGPGS